MVCGVRCPVSGVVVVMGGRWMERRRPVGLMGGPAIFATFSSPNWLPAIFPHLNSSRQIHFPPFSPQFSSSNTILLPPFSPTEGSYQQSPITGDVTPPFTTPTEPWRPCMNRTPNILMLRLIERWHINKSKTRYECTSISISQWRW